MRQSQAKMTQSENENTYRLEVVKHMERPNDTFRSQR